MSQAVCVTCVCVCMVYVPVCVMFVCVYMWSMFLCVSCSYVYTCIWRPEVESSQLGLKAEGRESAPWEWCALLKLQGPSLVAQFLQLPLPNPFRSSKAWGPSIQTYAPMGAILTQTITHSKHFPNSFC